MSDQRGELTGHHADVALVELVDRLLDGGVVIAGDILLSIADVDLVYVSLRLLLSSVHRLQEQEQAALAEAGR